MIRKTNKDLKLISSAIPFLHTVASRPALGPIHSPIKWVPGVTSPGAKRL